MRGGKVSAACARLPTRPACLPHTLSPRPPHGHPRAIPRSLPRCVCLHRVVVRPFAWLARKIFTRGLSRCCLSSQVKSPSGPVNTKDHTLTLQLHVENSQLQHAIPAGQRIYYILVICGRSSLSTHAARGRSSVTSCVEQTRAWRPHSKLTFDKCLPEEVDNG